MTMKLIWNENKIMEVKSQVKIYKDFCFPEEDIANIRESSLFHKSRSRLTAQVEVGAIKLHIFFPQRNLQNA